MFQWYVENKKLYELEIEAIKHFYLEAKYGFLPDKKSTEMSMFATMIGTRVFFVYMVVFICLWDMDIV